MHNSASLCSVIVIVVIAYVIRPLVKYIINAYNKGYDDNDDLQK